MELLNNFECIIENFNKITANQPSVNKIKDKLIEIKSFAANASALTDRQKEAVIARINNYLNGSYGNSKKPEHYGQTKIH